MFIFNIFTGAVIFLILSLKIEKTSSTFQEKKLRREMGEIITEFNSTAERNITLLENRISILKKILNENGSLKGIDFTVLDDKMKDNINKTDTKENFKTVSAERSIEKQKKKITDDDTVNLLNDEHNIMGTFMDKIQSFSKSDENSNVKEKAKKTYVSGIKKEAVKTPEPFSIIEKNVKDINVRKSSIDFSADEEIILTYDKHETVETVDFEELFQNSNDKYSLIARLFNEGHTVEDISKYSGLPAGEIKLVISLNS
jgi:hypothetical protein